MKHHARAAGRIQEGEPMRHLMVDIETLATGHRPAILSIGAVFFDPYQYRFGRTFYATLDYEEMLFDGFVASGDTLAWWKEQSKEAWEAATKDARSPKEVLQHFAWWIHQETPDPLVWGNGSNFDNRILREAYAAYGLACPWGFRSDRDARTLAALGAARGIGKTTNISRGLPHHALDDAWYQVDWCCRMFLELGLL